MKKQEVLDILKGKENTLVRLINRDTSPEGVYLGIHKDQVAILTREFKDPVIHHLPFTFFERPIKKDPSVSLSGDTLTFEYTNASCSSVYLDNSPEDMARYQPLLERHQI